MLEVEIKARVENPDEIRRKILELGFKFKERIIEKDFYYNHPCRNFKETDEALRIRIKNNKYFLTYKGKKIDNISKTREELTSVVDENIVQILERLGFEFVAEIEKVREIYEKDYVKICLDKVSNLGFFVEIESEKYDLEELFKIARDLGLREFTRKSYLEMFLETKR